jgi:CheY-like chemotaxis protein
MVGVAENVTERHRLIDELQRSTQLAEAANESKSLFLANMSHELRTPLNGVMGMLQLLSKSELNANQQELAGYALDSCRKLLRLLSDILDLTRIESGKMSLESKAFDLRATIRDATEMFRDAAAVKDLGLSWRVPDEAPSTLVGDELRIRQILSNLVGNAVKFTTEGRIEVEANVLSVAESARSRLLLTVADTGIGIADEQLETIFQNFSQADESFTRTHQGAGLGLSIVKRLVNAMGGEVAVDTAIGQGATLYVTLPTTVAEAEAPAPEPAPAKPAEKEQPLRILLVEDEVINSLAARKLLERLGHAVVHAPDGLRAVEAVQESGDFDLVLMDIQMPGIDGVEATRRIRERGFTAPIAAMTAYAMAGDRERFLDAGMDDYLAKPIEIDDLRALLARVTGAGG